MRVLVSAVSAASLAVVFFACANGSDAVIEVDGDGGSGLGLSSGGADSGGHITFGGEDASRGDAKASSSSSSSSTSSTSSSGSSGTSSSGSSGTSTSSSGSSGTSTSSTSSSSSSGSTSGDCTGTTSAGAAESYDFACDDLATAGYEDDCTPGGTDCNALAGSLGIATWCCYKPKSSGLCSGDYGGIPQCVPK